MTEQKLPSAKRYSKLHYKSKILSLEKKLIGLALKKTGNDLFEAWLLNCPVNKKNPVPRYSIEAYYKVVIKHGFQGIAFVGNNTAKKLLNDKAQKETMQGVNG